MVEKQMRNQRNSIILLPVIILISLACICQYDPYAHYYSTEEPTIDAVVGIYELKEQTITAENLEILQGEKSIIELNSDGSYEVANFPDWEQREETGNDLPELIAETGAWNIGKVGSVSSGSGTVVVWGVRFSGIQAAHLTSNTSPHGLIFTYGDPDAGDVMIYEKIE